MLCYELFRPAQLIVIANPYRITLAVPFKLLKMEESVFCGKYYFLKKNRK